MNVSVLVPWRAEPGNPARQDAWRWIEQRWRALTDYELITGTDSGVPFSKTSAINDAFLRASGDVLILADADTWCTGRLAQACEVALDLDRLVIPWASSYRLSARLSSLVTASPADSPDPWPGEVRGTLEYNPPPSTAAMTTIISRRAFIEVGGDGWPVPWLGARRHVVRPRLRSSLGAFDRPARRSLVALSPSPQERGRPARLVG